MHYGTNYEGCELLPPDQKQKEGARSPVQVAPVICPESMRAVVTVVWEDAKHYTKQALAPVSPVRTIDLEARAGRTALHSVSRY